MKLVVDQKKKNWDQTDHYRLTEFIDAVWNHKTALVRQLKRELSPNQFNKLPISIETYPEDLVFRNLSDTAKTYLAEYRLAHNWLWSLHIDQHIMDAENERKPTLKVLSSETSGMRQIRANIKKYDQRSS